MCTRIGILHFGLWQETRRRNIDVELLKHDRHLTASGVDGTKKEVSSA